jgi:hypothetical protein
MSQVLVPRPDRLAASFMRDQAQDVDLILTRQTLEPTKLTALRNFSKVVCPIRSHDFDSFRPASCCDSLCSILQLGQVEVPYHEVVWWV